MHQSMSQEMRQTLHLSQKQTIRLTQEQRLQIQEKVFANWLQLITVLRGEQLALSGNCPSCDKRMKPMEIIRGFNRDPNDFSTCCPECGQRFAPQTICFAGGKETRMPFFCQIQMEDQLRGKEKVMPESFALTYPGLYRSAIIHHGTLREAYKHLGIDYPHAELADWKKKIIPFLGRLPDCTIARAIDISVAKIASLRHELNIPRYTVGKTLAEMTVK